MVGLDEVEEEVAARTAGAPAVPAEGPGPRTAGAPGIVELVDQHVVPLARAGAVVRVALRAVAATAVGEGAAGVADKLGVGGADVRPGEGVAIRVFAKRSALK